MRNDQAKRRVNKLAPRTDIPCPSLPATSGKGTSVCPVITVSDCTCSGAQLKTKLKRRYVVKGYAGHPGWSGCTFAHSCSTVEAAERCFEKVAKDSYRADAILLIDREEWKVLRSIGTDDPSKLANYYGW